ncbi:MAG: hypothetical protein HY579_10420 [Nitrospinae bacterium]|nr:hypothetical protein [Nitrospinota bacterium]
MGAKDIMPEKEFNDAVKQAKHQLKVVSELKEKLEVLSEHVESRKQALEEEIEENLHQALRDARDSLELIRENIDPKLEKIVREKLEEIDRKVANWKNEFRAIVREEMESRSEEFCRNVRSGLEDSVAKKTGELQGVFQKTLKDDIEAGMQSALREFKEGVEKRELENRRWSLVSLGLSLVLALVLGFWIFAGR